MIMKHNDSKSRIFYSAALLFLITFISLLFAACNSRNSDLVQQTTEQTHSLEEDEGENTVRYCMFETCPEAFVEYRISASEVEAPQQAAETLMEIFLTELKKDDPMRTFTILDIVEVTCHLTGRAEIEQNPEYDWGYAYTDHCTLEENEWLTSCGATVTFQGQLNTNTDTNCGADWLRWGKLRLEDGTYIFTPRFTPDT